MSRESKPQHQILLIEPDRTLAHIYRTALERDGHSVTWRKTAESAVMALDEHSGATGKTSIDMVILELNVAQHNGVEFLYEIRSYSDWQDLPVILHTNVREVQVASPVLEQLRVSNFLYKPTTKLADLLVAVRAVAVV